MHAYNGCSQNADIESLNQIVLSSWDHVVIMHLPDPLNQILLTNGAFFP